MWNFIAYGTILGLSAGISPGPLLALVISQTLQHGAREGARIAMAPLITDVPIVLVGLFLFHRLGQPDAALGVLSFIGFAFVAYLGVSSFRQKPLELNLSQAPPRSFLKGFLTNMLSPHPYLFWFSVGVPTILKANNNSLLSAVGFVVAFCFCIVGAKMTIAVIVGRSRQFLSGAMYLWAMKAMGVLLIVFAFVLLYDGLTLTGVLP